MTEFLKVKRYIGRVTQPQSDKLEKILIRNGSEEKPESFSKWLRDRIEQQRIK